ncbi:hypothetical protein LEP1GSC060_3675 [Leptospira weilii serovar Ranarum str. ICFT]|uniref:Uncharacterized protein n=1 Tax=Leptospira weilii serovar Ranarum str. ICFT TaxID=1218598 RepID=N1WFZ4_9LEPT|nr:hypothetical protein LEP1GSC060_3675 [Leptospira weilii serovar Ranarum str. ICFT]
MPNLKNISLRFDYAQRIHIVLKIVFAQKMKTHTSLLYRQISSFSL